MTPIPDEPITERLRSEIENSESRQEVRRFRRESDRWDYWTRTAFQIVTSIISIVVVGLVAWLFDVRDTLNRQEIYTQQLQSDVKIIAGEQKELAAYRNNSASMEKIINAQMEGFNARLSDQDKRQQMQGEGLIAGNRSIHEALEKLMLVTGEISNMDRRVAALERGRR